LITFDTGTRSLVTEDIDTIAAAARGWTDETYNDAATIGNNCTVGAVCERDRDPRLGRLLDYLAGVTSTWNAGYDLETGFYFVIGSEQRVVAEARSWFELRPVRFGFNESAFR